MPRLEFPVFSLWKGFIVAALPGLGTVKANVLRSHLRGLSFGREHPSKMAAEFVGRAVKLLCDLLWSSGSQSSK